MATEMLIGDLAKQAGLTVKTLRYYETLGLLAPAHRRDSGYRTYAEPDLERLRFIKSAKALGLSLAEIKDIVHLKDRGQRPCNHVRSLLDDKLTQLDRRIDELTVFRDGLRQYKRQVEAAAVPEGSPCVHIDGVTKGMWHGEPPAADLMARQG